MLTVASKDGTRIAYEKTGQGPAIIVVDGALVDRSAGASLAKLLAPGFTVYCYDRRGRGDSADNQPYSALKEVEDIETMLGVAGGSAHLYGSSSGGALALEAAMRLGGKVKKLAIYEVPYDSSDAGVEAWRKYSAELSHLLAAGKQEDALILFMNFIGVPGSQLAGMRRSPGWPRMVELAPTLAYDGAVLGEDRKVPTERAARVTAETLVMDGSESREVMPFMRATALALAEAIPHAQHRVIEGQGHGLDPEVLAPILNEFFASKK